MLRLPVETDPLRLAFEHGGVGIAVHDPDGAVVSANPAIRALLGSDLVDLASYAEVVHPEERVDLGRALRTLLTGDAATVVAEHRLEQPDGSRCVRLHVTVARDGRGEMVALVTHAVDVTEQHEHARELLRQSLHDALTGLPNRTLLRDRLGHALSRTVRDTGSRVALLFLDLDRFKLVNDSLGHASGDAVLVEAADRLRATVRPSDTVARFGGDEFVVCCEDIRSREEAVAMAERILAAMREPFHPAADVVRVSTSIGIAYATEPGQTADDLLRHADAALYVAKRGGRDRFEISPGP